ncbi:MAG TPA: hypothetical protein VF278_23610 [Pirellulales bacterium]
MISNQNIIEILSAPLSEDWSIEALAEQILSAIAAQSPTASGSPNVLVLDAATVADRQARRLLRPLLACLAHKSARERGESPNLYEDRFVFERPGYAGPVWILGEFKNMPGRVRIVFRMSGSPPQNQETMTSGPNIFLRADARPDDSTAANMNANG